MHEFGLCAGILDAVERRAAGRRVLGVRVRAGALQRVSAEALEQAFSLIATGTVADGAAVELVTIPTRVRCRGCAQESEVGDLALACAACGATEVEVTAGDELLLESITVEEGGAHVSGHSE